MRYKIEGADAKTGKARVLRIEADDEEQAAARAHDMGVLVSAIHARPDMATDREIGLSDMNSAPARSASASSYTAMPASTATPTNEQRKHVLVSPEYAGLRAVSILLHILALLTYVVGLITLMVSVYSATHWDWHDTTRYILATGAGLIVSGAVLHGMSASCDALRDIAQNSFRK
jgi:hypothetical protein